MYLNQEEKETFSNFGKNFQECLAISIVKDRPFSEQIGEVLEFDYFDLRYLREFVRIFYECKKQYDIHPSIDVLRTILNTTYSLDDVDNAELNLQIHTFFKKVQNPQTNNDDEIFVKNRALDFCKKQTLKKAILQSWGLLKHSSFDEIGDIIKRSLQLGTDMNYGYDYLLDFEKRYEYNHRHVISTPWSEINNIMGGGHGKGELGVVIGPTGSGKSMVLVALASEALRQGKTVVYYTLELRDTVIGNRFDSCLTSIELNELSTRKQEVFSFVKNVPGRLLIKEYPMRSISVQTLKNHVEKMISNGIVPDMICVDYGDLLRPDGDSREVRHGLGQIYEDLRGLAQMYDCSLWTASQTNRKGLSAVVVSMEEISEAFNKCFVADMIIGLSRTSEDKVRNTGRFFIAKNRNGQDGYVYPLTMDTRNVNIQVLPWAETSFEEAIEQAAREEAETVQQELASKYEKFKNKQRGEKI